jgi:FkbM family methyltransferase
MSRFSRWMRPQRTPPPPPAPPPLKPYEHLLWLPRYQVRAEQLFGEPFQIADGVSFYCSHQELILNELYRFQTTNLTPRIVDCGAHCGLSVVYFKRLYPSAHITAVEADPQIFDLLRANVARRGLADVTLINKAIAVGADRVTFHREGADAGRIHMLAGSIEKISVPAISLDELLTEPIDLLKLDVEGVETEVLCASRRLRTVSQLIVEYHSFADAPQSLHALLTKLSDDGFRYKIQTQYCPPRPLVDEACHLGMDLQLNIFATRTASSAARQAA